MNELESPVSVYCQYYLDKIKEISLDNKYTKWYLALCRKAALRFRHKRLAKLSLGYVESHHIILRAFKLGGGKDVLNLVHFTAREHFVAHLIMTKMVTKEDRRYAPIIKAFAGMSEWGGQRRLIRGRKYNQLRIEVCRLRSEQEKGKPLTPARIAAYERIKNNPSEKAKAEYASRKLRPRTPAQIAANLAQRSNPKPQGFKRGKPYTEEQMKAAEVRKQNNRETIIARNKAMTGRVIMVLTEVEQPLPACVDVAATLSVFGYDPRFLKPSSTRVVMKRFSCCGELKPANRNELFCVHKPNQERACSRACSIVIRGSMRTQSSSEG